MNEKKYSVKGFTLMEMIIVLAIIGILLGILMPSMISYYRSSRIKTANNDAKMVYNTVQTEVIRFMSSDRAKSDAAKSGFQGTAWISYRPDGTREFSTDPSKPSSLTTLGSETEGPKGACNKVIDKVNLVVSNAPSICWAAYVNNYIVQASVAANSTGSNYIGFYSANKQQATDPNSTPYSSGYLDVLNNVKGAYEPITGSGS